jgi:hypothetical protein
VGGSEAKKDQGQTSFFLRKNARKRTCKGSLEQIGFGFLSTFLQKLFDTTFLQNVFCGVFELPSLKNTRKRDKLKEIEEKLTSKFLSIVLEKKST